jgi:hypothetical protein
MPDFTEERTYNAINDLRQSVQKTNTLLTKHVEQSVSFRGMVNNHELELEGPPGNGPGLKTRLYTVETTVETLSVEASKRHARIMSGMWKIGCGIVLCVCGIMIEFFFHN